MDLFEYQGKQYFARFGIPISQGGVADTVDEAVAQAEAAGYPVVVKAQVKVGGRGKAGGVKLADDADEVRLHAGNILGLDIKGHVVKRLWVEHASDIAKEYYASFTLDRPRQEAPRHALGRGRRRDRGGGRRPTPTPSPCSTSTPSTGSTEEAAREWVDRADLDPEARDQAAELLVKLYHCYVEGDCDLAEINPLDPHPRRQGPRPRRQGHPRRQRRLPPSRVGGVRRTTPTSTEREDGQGEGPQLHRPRRLGRASSPTAPGWP